MTGFVVSHTHWDRAWYLPFERFRVRLVRLVERLCDLLEADPAFAAFTLDGQTVLLDDVFDVRPDLRPRVERLVATGRLVVGPFYVLPDLFLVSFESLARNLSRGLALRDALGTPPGASPVGYVPDPFGQPEAMPTLLRGFGIDAFFFSRGLGSAHGTDDPLSNSPPRAAFWWAGPDGARVLALYGRDGYFNAAALGHADDYGRFDGASPDAALAVAQIEATADRFRDLLPDGAPLLLLNGFDHMPEQAALPALLDAVGAERPDWDLRHTTLADYVDALRETLAAGGEALPVVRGDLLGNAHHPVLASVWSTRLYLKRAHDAAERFLLDVAEPVAAMLPAGLLGMEATPDARPLLALAWRSLLRAQPHDDLCGCSVDAVHLDTEAAIRHARETALEAVRERLDALVLGGLAPTDAPAGTDVIVLHPHPTPGRVTVDVDVLVANDGGEFGTVPPPRRLAAVDGDGRAVEVVVLSSEAPVLRSAYLSATWGRRYRVRLTLDAPACGYTVVRVYEDGDADGDASAASVLNDAAAALARRLRIEWERDAGDTYSFSPVPEPAPDGDADASAAPRIWTARLAHLRPHPTDPRTVRATWTLDVPACLNADPTGLSLVPDGSAPTVRLTLRAELRDDGAAGVSVRVRYANRARDGRLRLVVPTGCDPSASIRTGSHLGLTPRTRIEAETPETAPARYAAFPGELDYATHPMRDFVLIDDAPGEVAPGGDIATGTARRAWVAARGLPEVETRADAGETWVAVTLCRSVGWLSRKGGRIRRVAAGPQLPTPGAQCLRTMGGDVLVGSTLAADTSEAEAAGHARAFAHPAWATELPALPHAPPTGDAPRAASWLAVDDAAVRLLSLRPETSGPGHVASGVVVRLVNPTAEARTAHLTLGFEARHACRTDLRERWDDGAAEPVEDGRMTLAMGPGEVVTVVVRGLMAADLSR